MTTPSARVWFATFVSLVFLTGMFAGVALDRTWLLPDPPRLGPPGGGRGAGGGPPEGPPPSTLVADLDRELDLTDAQSVRILAVLEGQRPRLRQLQEEARQRFNSEQQALHAAIEAELSPAQAVKFRELVQRRPLGPGRMFAPPGGRGGRAGRGRE